MDFRVTDDQKELARAVRAFADKRVPAAGERSGSLDRAFFSELGELGLFSLCLSEEIGGLARPFADAVLVFEEVGRALLPTVLAWTHLGARFVDGASSGERVVGGVAAPSGSAWIEHAGDLDALVVLHADRVERLEPRQLALRVVESPLDPLTPVAIAESLPVGERAGGADEAARLRREGTALVASQLLGIAGATLALAVDYAKVREQFKRPIGSFQAIKHILAEMFVRLEVARAAVYAAGATIDTPEVGDVERAVRVAKLKAAEAAIGNARACIQVHGGMGYTWDIPAHFFLKRALVLETTFGTRAEHARALGAACS
jgi:alkylation response protein AidB-like acyl-CoA dehydrogenase